MFMNLWRVWTFSRKTRPVYLLFVDVAMLHIIDEILKMNLEIDLSMRGWIQKPLEFLSKVSPSGNDQLSENVVLRVFVILFSSFLLFFYIFLIFSTLLCSLISLLPFPIIPYPIESCLFPLLAALLTSPLLSSFFKKMNSDTMIDMWVACGFLRRSACNFGVISPTLRRRCWASREKGKGKGKVWLKEIVYFLKGKFLLIILVILDGWCLYVVSGG